jgi:hypothetical protein
MDRATAALAACQPPPRPKRCGAAAAVAGRGELLAATTAQGPQQ